MAEITWTLKFRQSTTWLHEDDVAADIKELFFQKLKSRQINAVKSKERRVLVVAGAGSGKTEVMARRMHGGWG